MATDTPLLGIITNPNSRKNRLNPGRYDDMRATVGTLGQVRRTQHTGAIAEVVRDFLDLGIPYWVADGGDGAFHWLVNVLVQVIEERGGRDPMPALMPTNAGTIDFLGRKAGVVGRADDLIRTLCRELREGRRPETLTLQTLDLRGVHGPDSDLPGRPFRKIGFAAALAGVSQRIFDKFYAMEDQGPSGLVKMVSKTLASAASQGPVLRHLPLPVTFRHYADSVFERQKVSVWIDGQLQPFDTVRDLSMGSIDLNLANVFRLFPYANEPGRMHVQCGDPGPLDVLKNLPQMATGKPLRIAGYYQGPASHVRAVARDGGSIDPVIDGELYWGLSEAEVQLGPSVRVVRLKAV
jgi:hypothetical protein